MIESYILIFSSLILSVGNFVLWWLLFDEDFTQRLEIYETAYREQMKRENEDFVKKMGGIIDLDPEAVEKIKGPIGLEIDAETPEEIAISIVAELIQQKRG